MPIGFRRLRVEPELEIARVNRSDRPRFDASERASIGYAIRASRQNRAMLDPFPLTGSTNTAGAGPRYRAVYAVRAPG